MTAAEIRKMLEDNLVTPHVSGALDEQALQSVMLAEIAAQLAEMNERASTPDRENVVRENAARLAIAFHNLKRYGNAMIEIIDRHRCEGWREIRFNADGAADIDAAIAAWKKFIST